MYVQSRVSGTTILLQVYKTNERGIQSKRNLFLDKKHPLDNGLSVNRIPQRILPFQYPSYLHCTAILAHSYVAHLLF
jgi:hypothetical protein